MIKRIALIASAMAAGLALAACGDIAADGAGVARLSSPVGPGTLQQARAIVARGDKQVDVGDWSRPDHLPFMSGGDATVAREVADLFSANGVRVRVVGLAGSALAEIVLTSAGCTVSPNGEVMPHLAFVQGGTAAQNRAAERDSSRWWLEHGADPDLVDRLERSPDHSWRMRPAELAKAGCTIE